MSGAITAPLTKMDKWSIEAASAPVPKPSKNGSPIYLRLGAPWKRGPTILTALEAPFYDIGVLSDRGCFPVSTASRRSGARPAFAFQVLQRSRLPDVFPKLIGTFAAQTLPVATMAADWRRFGQSPASQIANPSTASPMVYSLSFGSKVTEAAVSHGRGLHAGNHYAL
jgi:hypothetical protein